MIRRSGLAVAAILAALLLAFPVSTAAPAAAEPPPCPSPKSFYGLQYQACIFATANTFRAKLYGWKTHVPYTYGGVKLAIRITSNGARVTGQVCESGTIDALINAGNGSEASCEVQTPRGHTGNTVRAEGWIAFDERCGEVPPCLGYHSAYPDLSKSTGIIS
jgi:hypothetical protein